MRSSRRTAPRSHSSATWPTARRSKSCSSAPTARTSASSTWPCVDPCAFDATPTLDADRRTGSPTRRVDRSVRPGSTTRPARRCFRPSSLDGADPMRLSEPGIDGVYEDYYARYSPDGSYIVFTRVRNDPLALAHSG